MSEKALVIVESPTKANTIKKFLGKDYTVIASMGHVRDLPNSASEIPLKYKKEAWARIGVNTEKNFEPLYVIPKTKKDHVKKLKDALKGVDILYLATDEDREGESISWHVLEILQPKVPVKRLVFHEITKEAIKESLINAREIDENLVHAQETRRIIDRLFGYEVSPLLWKKMLPRLSAGRVQSVACKLLVEREKARIAFVSANYWTLKANFLNKDSASFEAELAYVGERRVASGKDFDPDTGKLKNADKVALLSEKDAKQLKEKVLNSTPTVSSVEEKPFTSKPPAPFVTSTLQQEGNRKLRLSARHTMSVAQKLYENGFITYMRTDSTTLSGQALTAARTLIAEDFGAEYLPAAPRVYTTKVKNAQEAHEAIRPAGERFTPMEEVKEKLGPEAFKLYEMIWKRTVASQMKDAEGTYINVQIDCAEAKFRSSGKTISFPGYLRAYVEGSDDPEADLADQEKVLPKLSEKEQVKTKDLEALERNTQAPARYTEGSLIKELERLGIGRPSTWASIVELVLSRSYVFKKGTALVPTFTAFGVVNLLESNFEKLLSYEFTAKLEDDLDAIARGEEENVAYLRNFYFGNSAHPGLKDLVKKGEQEIDPRIVCGIAIGKTEDGKDLEVRIGRYGPFLSNGEQRASLHDELPPDEITVEEAVKILETANKAPEALGADPETGLNIFLKNGRFGPYVQRGTKEELGEEKPKMASLLSGKDPSTVDLAYALQVLSLPRKLGQHAELKEEITAANGRFGPYIKCGSETRSIPMDQMSPIDITFEQAVALLKEPKKRGRGAGSAARSELKVVGKHPVSEKEIKVLSGRYGHYVSDGEINASLRKDMKPETITIEEAVNLLEERAAKIAADGGVVKKRGRKKKK